MKHPRKNQTARRLSYLAAPVLFLFFLIEATPHRVHHVFEHGQSAAEACPVFSVAKGCHLNKPPSIHLYVAESPVATTAPFLEAWIPSLPPSPFSKRAPPAA